ncbi:MAG: hypothetical protein ACREMR_03095 [Gemmatimonadales bacterium]
MTVETPTSTFPVRVMVTDVWDQVVLAVEPGTPVAEVKRQALERALRRSGVRVEDYVVKFRGAEVLDESVGVGALGAEVNSPFIVLPARRRPVR